MFQNCQEHDHGPDVGARAGVRVRDVGGVRLRPRHLRQCDRVRREAAQAEASALRNDQHAGRGACVI